MSHKIPLAKKQAAATKRAGLSTLVDEYVEGLTGWKQDVAQALRKFIRTARLKLTEEVKWGWPCYTAGGKNICGFLVQRDTVNFILHLGAQLDDPDGLIEGTGKSMRHVKLCSTQEIRKRAFTKFIRESIQRVKA